MSEPTLRMRSVKYDDGAIEIVAHETHQASADQKEIKLTSSDEPRTEFLEPFVNLQREVRRLLDLPSDYAAEQFAIKKVVWSYSEATGVRGATICCQAKLDCADAPLILNTPHLAFEQMNEGGNAPVMPRTIIANLNMLEAEALLFMNGKRAQGDLFESEPVRNLAKSIARGEVEIEVMK